MSLMVILNELQVEVEEQHGARQRLQVPPLKRFHVTDAFLFAQISVPTPPCPPAHLRLPLFSAHFRLDAALVSLQASQLAKKKKDPTASTLAANVEALATHAEQLKELNLSIFEVRCLKCLVWRHAMCRLRFLSNRLLRQSLL